MTARLCLSAAVLLLVLDTTLSAQRVVQTQFSAGGTAFISDPTDPPLGGWYADAMQAIGWQTGFVAEASGFYGPQRQFAGRQQWFAALVGLRQRLKVTQAGTAVWAQFLTGLGRSSAHSRAETNDMLAFQPGLLIDVPMNARWGLRVRTDWRVGFNPRTFDGNAGVSAGVGVNRYWGKR